MTFAPAETAHAVHPAALPRAGQPAAGLAIAFTVHDDLAEVEQEWRALETAAVRTVFQSFDWLAAWQREIGTLRGVRPAIAVGRDPGGAVACIFPMAIETRRRVRRLTFLGSELCDYNSPLLAPGLAAGLSAPRFRDLWRALMLALRRDPRFRFHLVDLQKMPELLAGRPNPFLALSLRVHPNRAYVATLGHDWDAFYAERRSAATRKTERKQFKRLSEQGEVRFTQPDGAADRTATIDILIGQKRRALGRMGADDIFDRAGYVSFYRAIAAAPAMRGLVSIGRLDVGGEVGAASVALIERGTCSLVLSSYHDGALAQFGPGRAHLHSLMRWAIDHGLSVFDFTIGDEPYKRDWCDREVTLYDYLVPASPRAVPLVAALRAFRAATRLVKQTPALWEAFRRLRARFH